jgi:hypothetical protein
VIYQLKRADDPVSEYALLTPGVALSHRKAEEDSGFPILLGDDGKSVTEVLKNILAGWNGNLPSRKAAPSGLLQAKVPAGDLASKTGYTGMLEFLKEGHLKG